MKATSSLVDKSKPYVKAAYTNTISFFTLLIKMPTGLVVNFYNLYLSRQPLPLSSSTDVQKTPNQPVVTPPKINANVALPPKTSTNASQPQSSTKKSLSSRRKTKTSVTTSNVVPTPKTSRSASTSQPATKKSLSSRRKTKTSAATTPIISPKPIKALSYDERIKIFDTKLKEGKFSICKDIIKADNEKFVNKLLKRSKELKKPYAKEILKHILSSHCFKTFMDKKSQLILTDTKNNDKYYSPWFFNKVKMVFNNDGYVANDPIANNSRVDYIKGQRLFLDDKDNTPIGYNIAIPADSKVDQILVIVYGGDEASKREKNANKPDDPFSPLEKYLLENKTAIIKLNLPDLLKLKVFQSLMPDDLHQEIHACINKFYQVLKNSPEKLHPILKDLHFDLIRTFLDGCSFGGRSAIRHLQLHPELEARFDGYISDCGSLSFEVNQKSSFYTKKDFTPSINPGTQSEVSKIVAPVLIMQSKDDNKVNLNVALDFYNKLTDEQKRKYARMYLYESHDQISHKTSMLNRGHSKPRSYSGFLEFANKILTFMRFGPQAIPQYSEATFLQEKNLANRFNKSASCYDTFCAFAHELYLLKKHTLKDIDKKWAKLYQPLFNTIYWVDTLVRDPIKFNAEMTRLKNNHLIDVDVATKMFNSQRNLFVSFMKEYYKFDLPSDFKFDDKESQKNLHDYLIAMIDNLDSQSIVFKRYFLKALYEANPCLLEAKKDVFKNDANLTYQLTKAKNALKTLLDDNSLSQNPKANGSSGNQKTMIFSSIRNTCSSHANTTKTIPPTRRQQGLTC